MEPARKKELPLDGSSEDQEVTDRPKLVDAFDLLFLPLTVHVPAGLRQILLDLFFVFNTILQKLSCGS